MFPSKRSQALVYNGLDAVCSFQQDCLYLQECCVAPQCREPARPLRGGAVIGTVT